MLEQGELVQGVVSPAEDVPGELVARDEDIRVLLGMQC